MDRICLDTTAYSWFQRNEKGVAELLDEAEWVGVPAIVLGELHAGFARGARKLINESQLKEFLSLPAVAVLHVDREVGRIYGELLADLKRRGRPIPINDVWIGATCVRAGATLLTFDQHFLEMPRVSVHWIE